MIVGLFKSVYQNSNARNILNAVKAKFNAILAQVKEAFTLPEMQLATA